MLRNPDLTLAGTALVTNKTSSTPPIIGITTYHQKEAGNFSSPVGYADAVRRAGGVPILLLYIRRLNVAIRKFVSFLVNSCQNSQINVVALTN